GAWLISANGSASRSMGVQRFVIVCLRERPYGANKGQSVSSPKIPADSKRVAEPKACWVMTCAPLLFPRALRYPFVAVLYPVIQIKGGNRSERLVIVAFLAQAFLDVFVEAMERFQLLREGRLLLARRSTEELLESAIHQPPNLAAHQDAGLFRRVA